MKIGKEMNVTQISLQPTKTSFSMPKATLTLSTEDSPVPRPECTHAVPRDRTRVRDFGCGHSPAYPQVARFGVILGSRLIVDPKMLGFDVCALIGICVQDPMYMMQTMEKLKEIPEIVECHFITGNFNILVKTLLPGQRTPDENHFRRNSAYPGHFDHPDLPFRSTRLSNAR